MVSKVDQAKQIISEANAAFVDEEFQKALTKFTEAIALDGSNSEYYSKRSHCHFQMENYTDSIADAKKAIELDTNNAKAYFRKGMAAFSLDEFETAKAAFTKAQELAPSSQNKTWIRKCVAELEDEKDHDGESSDDVQTAPEPAPVHSAKPSADGPPPLELDEEPKKPQPTASHTTTQAPSHSHTTAHVPAQPQTTTKPTEPAKPPASNKPRHEWYQTNTHVFVSLFVKNVKKEDAKIAINEKNVDIEIKLPATNSEFQMNFDLLDKINPQESSYSILSTKIEFKLKKSRDSKWSSLEDVGGSVQAWDTVVDNKKEKGLSYPSSSKHGAKNWDTVAGTEPDDKLEGDAALNKLFQDIYKGASDEQRRAMQKSFQESGGTVLSTNWDEVGKGEVKGQPPKGMDMKYWKDL
jgi:suppressor of G2 allele of SKP1